MKKVNWAIFLASLFITGVMGYLMWSGVHLKARRMVKWSEVSGPEEAGKKLALFLYPLMGEYNGMLFVGAGEFSNAFYSSFKTQEESNDRRTWMGITEKDPEPCAGFTLHIRNIDSDNVEGCKRGEAFSCLAVKAQKKFQKKPRDESKYWINMYRTDSVEGVLFYKAKTN